MSSLEIIEYQVTSSKKKLQNLRGRVNFVIFSCLLS